MSFCVKRFKRIGFEKGVAKRAKELSELALLVLGFSNAFSRSASRLNCSMDYSCFSSESLDTFRRRLIGVIVGYSPVVSLFFFSPVG